MKILTSLHILLFLSLTASSLSAQTELEIPVQVYHIGTIIDDEAVIIDQEIEFQNWITSHTDEGISGNIENFNGELVLDQRSGWNYVANWNQGSSEILIRFQLIQANEKLNLLEVGSFQTCICEGCTDLQFSKEMPACECEGGDCPYVMGENLH